MRTTTLVWRLARPNGRPTRCLVSAIDGRWDVVVWNNGSIALWERCHDTDEASRRADELWTMLVAYGCEPVGEPQRMPEVSPFVRGCLECDRPAAGVRHWRGGYLVMACAACGHTWNDRARSTQPDRRALPRPAADRRTAA